MSGDEGPSSASSSQQSAQLLASEIKGLPCFNPKDDPNTLSIRWKRWKRSFKLYLRAKGITMDLQKVALLLHTGGTDFQEFYYTLIPEGEEKSLEESFEVLDDYFVPKVNATSYPGSFFGEGKTLVGAGHVPPRFWVVN